MPINLIPAGHLRCDAIPKNDFRIIIPKIIKKRI